MKILLRVLLGLFFSSYAALANADLVGVPFVIGRQQFKAGDSVVIEQVLASSPKLGVGDKVVVRGRYRVASTAKARLGLLSRTRQRPTPIRSRRRR